MKEYPATLPELSREFTTSSRKQAVPRAEGNNHYQQLCGLAEASTLHLFLDSMGQTDINLTQLQLPRMWRKFNKNSAGRESLENLQNARTTVKHFSLFLVSVHTSVYTGKLFQRAFPRNNISISRRVAQSS